MSDQVLVAVIGAVAGILGGLIGAFASPIGKDWLARRDSTRAATRQRADARETLIKRTVELLVVCGGLRDSVVQAKARAELEMLAQSLDDAELIAAIDRYRRGPDHEAGLMAASRRAGRLLAQVHDLPEPTA